MFRPKWDTPIIPPGTWPDIGPQGTPAIDPAVERFDLMPFDKVDRTCRDLRAGRDGRAGL